MHIQYHLKGKFHSGRGVRLRMLTPSETEELLKQAATLVGKDATVLELKKTEWRLGIRRFMVQFSEPCDAPETAKWSKLDASNYDDFDTMFTAKDAMVLEHLFREMHEVNQDEVDAIAGKGLPVSVG